MKAGNVNIKKWHCHDPKKRQEEPRGHTTHTISITRERDAYYNDEIMHRLVQICCVVE